MKLFTNNKIFNKEAFTLIELIGVVIILGILVTLSFPPILNLIKGTKTQLSEATKQLMYTAAKEYLNQNENLYPKMADTTYCLSVNELVNNDLLNDIITTSKTDEITLDTKIKVYVDNEARYTYEIDNSCETNIEPNVIVKNKTGIFDSEDWAMHPFYVQITTTGDSYKYCIGTSTCVPTVVVNNKIGTAYITTNSSSIYVCAQGISGEALGQVICSTPFKLDDVTPTLIAKTEDFQIKEGDSNLVSSYFDTPTYGIRGGSLSCSPIDTSGLSVGNQTVSCTAMGNNGLSTTVSKNITVKLNTFLLTYGGSGEDNGQSIITTSDGGYMLIGYTYSSNGDITDGNNGNSDVLIMKLNSDGSKVWDKTYGGSGDDYGYSIVETSDGGYILIGSTKSSNLDITDGNSGNSDVLIMKLNNDGSKVWDKTYGGIGNDYGYSIIEDSNNNYIIIGYTYSSDIDITDGNNGQSDVLVMKLNSDGSKIWDKTYGGSNVDIGYSIVETNDGGYMLTGYTQSNNYDITDGNNGGQDVLIIKIDSNGNKVWDKTYGGSGYEVGQSIIKTSDGNYIIAGYTSSSSLDITDGNNGIYDALVIKIDSAGNKLWDKTFGGSQIEMSYSIIETSDGNYSLAGYTGSADGDITDGNNGNSDALIIKMDSNGSKIWDKLYGGSSGDFGNLIIQTSDGGYMLIGYTYSSNGDITDGNNGNSDVLVIKLDGNGNL